MTRQLAIDGPSGSGKSTIAKLLADRLGLTHLDTGAMYRSVTLALLEGGVDLSDEEAVEAFLPKISLAIRDGHFFLDGKDVSSRIRQEDVTRQVSLVSSYAAVRKDLTARQRQMAEEEDVVLDGRDIGTVVLPQADLKIFLTASVQVRARRRKKDEKAKTSASLEEIEEAIRARDAYDSSRALAPLRQAEDAIYLDSSQMTIQEVVDFIARKWQA